ncbi:MAG: thiamine pyrophosphate-binding protein, partial [Flavobacteriaceae bacterium]|nr:thiamine pyrophosphate-binding protein [Flavobacteriaceae bacterium]
KRVTSPFQQQWMQLNSSRADRHKEYLQRAEFSDLKVFDIVLATIPDGSQLQLGNSSVVRYAQLFDLNTTLKVFCNRGTSGIDGSTSTAIGASLPVNEQTIFITGDISFFYDSNALWNEHIRNDFRIILINNSGGGIFRIIPGPLSTNSRDYFESPHDLNAEHLCTMFGFDYRRAANEDELHEQLRDFYEVAEHPRLLEIQTPREENDRILKAYFEYLR